MKTGIAGGLGILAAFFVFSLLRPLSIQGHVVVDVFAAAVLLFGTLRGEIPGAVMGAVCGLIVDAFSIGVFGLAGLSLTAGGFLAGFVSRKINILSWTRTLLFFTLLSAGIFFVWAGLTVLIDPSQIPWSGGLVLLRPVVTGVAATLLHGLIRRIEARHER